MGWAAHLIEKLHRGETVQFRPSGSSMVPHIRSRQLCTIEPMTAERAAVGDIVLCRVAGREYLHLVRATRGDGEVQIGNARGHVNGWTRQVFGKLVKVEA